MGKNIPIEISSEIMESWQEITDILAGLLNIPAALIMRYVDPNIEVFVASGNEDNPYNPGDQEKLFGSGLYCETVIKTKKKLHVPNALIDNEWKNNPDVELNMISYLGFQIQLPDGSPFGTLCVLDRKHNDYSEYIEKLMMKFRSLIESHLEIEYMNAALNDKNQRLTDYVTELQALRGMVPICASCKSISDNTGEWKPIEQYLIHHPDADFSHTLCPECLERMYPKYSEDKG